MVFIQAIYAICLCVLVTPQVDDVSCSLPAPTTAISILTSPIALTFFSTPPHLSHLRRKRFAAIPSFYLPPLLLVFTRFLPSLLHGFACLQSHCRHWSAYFSRASPPSDSFLPLPPQPSSAVNCQLLAPHFPLPRKIRDGSRFPLICLLDLCSHSHTYPFSGGFSIFIVHRPILFSYLYMLQTMSVRHCV